MYINDLGYSRVSSVDGRTSTEKTADVIRRRNRDSYQTVMKKAVEEQKNVTVPTFASAGDVIIKEAFEKMKTDPEWEESVMNKVKEYYSGKDTVGSAQTSYLNWAGHDSLQNYMLQSLISGQSGLGMGLTGYSPYGYGSLAAAAYGSAMNSVLNSSLFGSWQL